MSCIYFCYLDFCETHLRVRNDADDLAVADHFLEVIFDRLLAQIVGPLLGGLGESLLLARMPLDRRTTEMLQYNEKDRTEKGPHQ